MVEWELLRRWYWCCRFVDYRCFGIEGVAVCGGGGVVLVFLQIQGKEEYQ